MSGPKYTRRQAYTELHIAVLLWGFTAILGRVIDLPAIDLVWWRVGLTSASLLLFIGFGRRLMQLPTKLLITYAGIGVIVGLHWLTFYGSVKLANASVTLVCMSTTSFFAAILEPLISRRPIGWLDLGLSLLMVPAMLLIGSTIDGTLHLGAVVGLLSALLAATFSVLNKQYIDQSDPYTITFVELFSAFCFLTVVMATDLFGRPAFYSLPTGWIDWLLIVVLALLCTTLTFVLSLRALSKLSAFASTLVVNLEPVYGIVLAALLLQEYEQLSWSFYLGTAIVLAIVMIYPALQKNKTKLSSNP